MKRSPAPGALHRAVQAFRRGGVPALAAALQRRAREAELRRLSPAEQYAEYLRRHVTPRPAPPRSGRTFRVLVAESGDAGSDAATRSSIAAAGARAEAVALGPGDALPPAGEADFVVAVAAGDRFAPGALDELARAAEGEADTVVYADEDVLEADGSRGRPRFKPAWSPLLSLTLPGLYPGVPTAVPASLWNRARSGGVPGWTGAALRAADAARRIVHVPLPLVSRAGAGERCPLLGSPDDRFAAACEAAARRGWGNLAAGARPGTARLAAGAEPLPRISVIVPTRDQPDLLLPLGRHLESRSGSLPLELIFVDHRTEDPRARDYLDGVARSGRARVLREEGPFHYARMIRRGVEASTGELLLLLNNDIEPLRDDWIESLARAAQLPGVAAAGALLLYPDGLIQHAGVVLGVGTVAGHLRKGERVGDEGPWPAADVAREVSAVTAACLMIRREDWDRVGGMDEQRLAVSYNDVDLCLKLSAAGRRVLHEPAALLTHHETVSRPREVDPAEVRTMRERWPERIAADLYGSPAMYRGTDRPWIELWNPGPLDPRTAPGA